MDFGSLAVAATASDLKDYRCQHQRQTFGFVGVAVGAAVAVVGAVVVVAVAVVVLVAAAAIVVVVVDAAAVAASDPTIPLDQ